MRVGLGGRECVWECEGGSGRRVTVTVRCGGVWGGSRGITRWGGRGSQLIVSSCCCHGDDERKKEKKLRTLCFTNMQLKHSTDLLMSYKSY